MSEGKWTQERRAKRRKEKESQKDWEAFMAELEENSNRSSK